MDEAVADRDRRAAYVDPVQLRTRDSDALERDVVRVVDLDSALAADYRDIADGDVVGRDDDAAAHDRPRLADELLAWSRRAGPGGRRPRGARSAAARERDSAQEAERASTTRARRADPAELASVLPVGQTHSGKTAWTSTCAEEPRAGEERERGLERRADPEGVDRAMTAPSSSRPRGSRQPAGLVVEPAVVGRCRTRARRRSSRPRARAATIP